MKNPLIVYDLNLISFNWDFKGAKESIVNQCKNMALCTEISRRMRFLYTRDLTYDDIIELKGICDMVEVYYNGGGLPTLGISDTFFDSR